MACICDIPNVALDRATRQNLRRILDDNQYQLSEVTDQKTQRLVLLLLLKVNRGIQQYTFLSREARDSLISRFSDSYSHHGSLINITKNINILKYYADPPHKLQYCILTTGQDYFVAKKRCTSSAETLLKGAAINGSVTHSANFKDPNDALAYIREESLELIYFHSEVYETERLG